MSESLRPHGLYSPWNSLSQNAGGGSLSLLQGIFLTQGSNRGLPHCGRILYQLSHKESPSPLQRSKWAADTSGSNFSDFKIRFQYKGQFWSPSADAKSRQSCPTLCDPTDGSPPGSRPWHSPGRNTGVGCHFLLQCRKVKCENEVAQSCPTLRDPMDCSLPGSAVHGISQARVLEWVAIGVLREL